jgi:hypothetical protein
MMLPNPRASRVVATQIYIQHDDSHAIEAKDTSFLKGSASDTESVDDDVESDTKEPFSATPFTESAFWETYIEPHFSKTNMVYLALGMCLLIGGINILVVVVGALRLIVNVA